MTDPHHWTRHDGSAIKVGDTVAVKDSMLRSPVGIAVVVDASEQLPKRYEVEHKEGPVPEGSREWVEGVHLVKVTPADGIGASYSD
jgi:hypothetical protein